MKHYLYLILLFLFFTCSITCKGQKDTNSISYIKYGFSFGYCNGYCYFESKYDSLKIITIRKSHTVNEADKVDTSKIDPCIWTKLINSFNFKEFKMLPKTIGCPDCLDGGAEWIEIGTPNKSYKVEFDYGNNIEVFSGLLKLLSQKK